MSYEKKTWLPRQGTGLNKFIVDGLGKVGITSSPDSISQEGTPLSAENFNDLENRIASGFDGLETELEAVNTRKFMGLEFNRDYEPIDHFFEVNRTNGFLRYNNYSVFQNTSAIAQVNSGDTSNVNFRTTTVLTIPQMEVGELRGFNVWRTNTDSTASPLAIKMPTGGQYFGRFTYRTDSPSTFLTPTADVTEMDNLLEQALLHIYKEDYFGYGEYARLHLPTANNIPLNSGSAPTSTGEINTAGGGYFMSQWGVPANTTITARIWLYRVS